ncbi:hypothetical protein CFAL_09375 [Corynebacterium falsenii DSM 44353]|uniref:DUF3349 domain-containing protein n=1 Tax=Corynebacterium falsenii TaxID=108486 RepID=A0A418Q9X5_9CORY|nr:DUF3349 domain-containing protein [Corynebacterium falsenii]AHI03792.1 hypothetical protein CFAL_09375 [Corynebacterium falsenii DSM 44353]MDC7103071.1 DUF3349 domain-containing protein [Corynebacterium falsenii]RIX36817.1 DUF3349 domain-containing protein [Corynebacterium falsenii]UBI04523.1 DUF3349 domain-containing protein [Corynebacterium falsenii]UBI07445.1 DUF3349 domain-containing protein [Corynebacterium falsenii]
MPEDFSPTNEPSKSPKSPNESLDWIERIRRWIYKGFPDGVPANQAEALMLVLKHRFTDAEVSQVVHAIMRDQRALIEAKKQADIPLTPEDECELFLIPDNEIEDYIRRAVNSQPDNADIERVAARLRQASEDEFLRDSPTNP